MTPQTRNWPRQLTPPQLAKLEWIQAQLEAGVNLHLATTPTIEALMDRHVIDRSYSHSERDKNGVVCRNEDGKALIKTTITPRGEEALKNGGYWR